MGLFSIDPARARAKLQRAVTGSVDGRSVRNAVLYVDAPRLGIAEGWAAGVARADGAAPMTADTPFISASVGKIAMAATAFALADLGMIDLDAPIGTWLDRDVLHALPVRDAATQLQRITPRSLTANRSGLPDYFDGEVHPPADGAPTVFDLLVSEPERAWTRAQLIAYASEHFGPFADPGEAFLYSDLNWDLLGLVFEAATGDPFHAVVRRHVLEPLGMCSTWYHALESPPDGMPPYADVFVRDVNLAHAPSLTADQAGGGLAGTAVDLARLIRGLADGTPVALDRLATDWTEDAMSRGLDYGYGTWRWRPRRIFIALWQLPNLRGASGSTNSYAYITDEGDVLAGTMNQADDPSRHAKFLLAKVVPTLMRARA